ncbi:MAG: type III-A CRISPR-associated protein Csm2 [Candidatus Pacearchaeota archaeon]
MNDYRRDNNRNFSFEERDLDLILNGTSEKTREILDIAKKFTEKYSVTQNQLRKLYDLIIDLPEDKNPRKKIAKVIIMLEYAKNRKSINNNFATELNKLLEKVLDNAEDNNKIKNFVDFMEALVAYSKGKR